MSDTSEYEYSKTVDVTVLTKGTRSSRIAKTQDEAITQTAEHIVPEPATELATARKAEAEGTEEKVTDSSPQAEENSKTAGHTATGAEEDPVVVEVSC